LGVRGSSFVVWWIRLSGINCEDFFRFVDIVDT
jgi:hypothetical protein